MRIEEFRAITARAFAIAQAGDIDSVRSVLAVLAQPEPMFARLERRDRIARRFARAVCVERLFDLDAAFDDEPVLRAYADVLKLISLDRDAVSWGMAERSRIIVSFKGAVRRGDRAAQEGALGGLERLAARLEPLARAPSAAFGAVIEAPPRLTIVRCDVLVDLAETALSLAKDDSDPLIEKAIAACSDGLEPLLPEYAPETWARGCVDMAAGFIRRGRAMEAPDDFAKALSVAQTALASANPSDFPELWLNALLNASMAAMLIRSEPLAARTRFVIDLLDDNADVARIGRTRPEIGAKVCLELADAWRRRPDGAVAENMERSLGAAERSLALARQADDPFGIASACRACGDALKLRAGGRRSENIEAALSRFDEGLAVNAISGTDLEAALLHDRAAAYQIRLAGDPSANLSEAVRSAESAGSIWAAAGNRRELARANMTLGNIEREKAYRGLHWSPNAAVRAYDRAVFEAAALRDQELCESARADRAAATLIDPEGDTDAAAGDLAAAVVAFELNPFPNKVARLSRLQGVLAFRLGDWVNALTAFDRSFEAFESLAASGLKLGELRRIMRECAGAGACAAYAAAQLGDPAGALERLDRSRARELVLGLDTFNPSLGPLEQRQARDARRRLAEIERDLEDRFGDRIALIEEAGRLQLGLQSLNPLGSRPLAELLGKIDIAVLAPVATSAGAVLLVGEPSGVVSAKPLAGPEMAAHLDEITQRWRRTVARIAGDPTCRGDWLELVSDTLRDLRQAWIQPLMAALAETPLERGAILLMPGELSALPLEAAFAGDAANAPDFRLAPSLRAYVAALAAVRPELIPALAVVADPTGDLPFARIEAASAGPLLGLPAMLVKGEEASRSRTIDALAKSSHWLFACHGRFEPEDPKSSALVLAREDRLTFQDLLETQTPAPLLAVLSACDSATHDLDGAPDEMLGLMTGFLQLGARQVVGNLWPVSDLAATLLSTRMLHAYAQNGGDARAAVRQARAWIRQVDGSGACDWLAALPGVDRRSSDVLERLGSCEGRPFENPYYWAGLVALGA